MNVGAGIVRLYPAPFRERWGAALEQEAKGAGWRSWPNLIVGIADMWLHPTVWPAESSLQRRRRAAATAFAFALGGGLLGYLVVEQGPRPTPAVLTLMNVCDSLTLLGLLFVAPIPRRTMTAIRTVIDRGSRRLALPTLLGAVALIAAHGITVSTSPAVLRVAVILCWWSALSLGAVRVCRVVADLGADVVVAPSIGRLRVGIGMLVAAMTCAALVMLWSLLTSGHLDPLPTGLGLTLLLLAAASTATLRDLRAVADGGSSASSAR
ncbi:MAG: hypothetical protein M3Y77_02170 [Actinomycetota bacterium]|nr:hypothetical protein [Actinomycetota bacterium]